MTPALVVGLLPAQAHRVRQAMGHAYRLRFVDSDGAQAIRRTSTVNIVALSYVTHGTQDRLKKLLQPGQTLINVRGRDRDVIDQLGNLKWNTSTAGGL